MQVFLVNAGYILMLAALLIGDILWLRTTLVAAQIFIIAYNVVIDNPTVAAWNTVFVSINTVQVVRLALKRRPVKIPEELNSLYNTVFFLLGPREFLNFWNQGQSASCENTVIVSEGQKPDKLYLITNGLVEAKKNEQIVAKLGAGQFVADMSLVSGEAASATVVANGGVSYHAWNTHDLNTIKKTDRDLYAKIQATLGYELAAKIRRANETKTTLT